MLINNYFFSQQAGPASNQMSSLATTPPTSQASTLTEQKCVLSPSPTSEECYLA